MANNPAFLLYSQDFLIGCAEMTHEEIGQYFRVLCYMHQKGRMTEETIRLLVGSVLVNVRLKFEIDKDGKWFNERLERVIEERKKFVESRKINGSYGGRPKKEKPNGFENDNLKKPNEIEIEDEIEDKEVSSLEVPTRYFESHYHQMLPPEYIGTWRTYIDDQTESKIKIHQHNVMSHLKAFKECYANGISPPELLEAFQQSSNKGIYWISKNLIERKNGTPKQSITRRKGEIDIDKYKRLAAKQPIP